MIAQVLATGMEIGGYRIEGLLGRGGMGVVYEATQLSLNRTVALKLLAAELSEDTTFRERFRREGRIQAGIEHAHIVTIFEAGELDEGVFIAMRLIRGPNLKQLVRSGDLDPLRALRLLTPIADALDTAHESGLIHRDVKPQNILVGRRDHAYLADFGLTKVTGDTDVTQTGQLMGTLDYVAPEQIRGESAGPSADIYALSCVVFECLAGTPPFQKASEAATLYAHISEPPPYVAGVAEVPAEVDEWLARGLAKQPHDRPETALELLAGMEEALRGDTPARREPAPPAPLPPEPVVEEPLAEPPRDGTEIIAPRGTPTRGDLRREWSPDAVVAAPDAPPAEEKAQRERRRPPPRPVLLATLGAGALAALAGFVLGNRDGDAEPTSGPRVSSAALGLRAPAGWAESDAPDIPGLRFTDPVSVKRGKGTVLAGIVDGSGETLLPTAFEERLRNAPKTGDAVKLGKLEAQRLENVDPRGEAPPMTIFVAPLESKVAAVACLEGTPKADCGAIAASLRLTGAVKGRPLGPSAAYAESLRKPLRRLDRERSAALRALRRARTPVGQARAAGDVAFAYQRAGRSLASAKPGALELRAHRRLMRALSEGYREYGKLSGAAGAGRRSAYSAARRGAAAADKAVRRAIADLRALGYRAE